MVRPGRDRLSGTIEVDETFIGGEKAGKRGRGAAGKELVVIAAQKDGRKIGRIRLLRVPDASGNSLENVITDLGNAHLKDAFFLDMRKHMMKKNCKKLQ